MTTAPVLLINFNRPERTARQVAALRANRPARVFFAVDGPRDDRPDEAARVAAVRRLASSIDWPCEVRTLFHARNLGCRRAPVAALNWFFSEVEEGIVLEDDCEPGPGFLPFATALLARYRDDARVGAVSGFNLYDLQSDPSASYHFNTHINIWGWATWRRVWRLYDPDMAPYLADAEAAVRRNVLTARARRAFLAGIDAVHRRGLQTWDYQFSLALMAHDLLTAVPRVKLVANRGQNDAATGTNTTGYRFDAHHIECLPGGGGFGLVGSRPSRRRRTRPREDTPRGASGVRHSPARAHLAWVQVAAPRAASRPHGPRTRTTRPRALQPLN